MFYLFYINFKHGKLPIILLAVIAAVSGQSTSVTMPVVIVATITTCSAPKVTPSVATKISKTSSTKTEGFEDAD